MPLPVDITDIPNNCQTTAGPALLQATKPTLTVVLHI